MYQNQGGFVMNQILVGNFITQKRKEKNMTQAKLGEVLGVSNKTISKWECGKCMPDYSVIEQLCQVLDITLSELMDGEEAADNSIRTYDNEKVLELLKRTQELETEKNILYGMILLVMGIGLLCLHYFVGGSNFRDWISGLLLGISIGEMLAGVFVVANGLVKKSKL